MILRAPCWPTFGDSPLTVKTTQRNTVFRPGKIFPENIMAKIRNVIP